MDEDSLFFLQVSRDTLLRNSNQEAMEFQLGPCSLVWMRWGRMNYSEYSTASERWIQGNPSLLSHARLLLTIST